ncbi:MAG TPA: SGNH/GDSL hydrolase family protein [Micromonospora sp.]|nr:SGNH/GDSL hydrolase family protein [Micromonospora sp.]
MRWQSFVAVGDSFTEGMNDTYEDGTFRGWADLVATRLALDAGPAFGYANLAIRGRLFPNVVAEQVPPAVEMKPDLISFAAGGNDVLRRNFDPYTMVERFGAVVGELRATGADVILFRFADVMARLPGQRIITPRVKILNQAVGETAQRHGATLVDLYADDEFLNPRLWSEDRLHLSAAGHRRVAAHVLTALGVECDPEWLLVPPRPEPSAWLAARAADLRWAGEHLAPWIKRRLTGRSSGDTVTAKRPLLKPFTAAELGAWSVKPPKSGITEP